MIEFGSRDGGGELVVDWVKIAGFGVDRVRAGG